jgi:hypothetical protein
LEISQVTFPFLSGGTSSGALALVFPAAGRREVIHRFFEMAVVPDGGWRGGFCCGLGRIFVPREFLRAGIFVRGRFFWVLLTQRLI